MESLKAILLDVTNAIKTRNFKNLNPHSKRILILSIIVIVLFFLSLWLMSDSSSQTQINKEISQSYEETQKENTGEYVPPKIDISKNNEQKQETKENSNVATPPQPINPFVAQDKDKEQFSNIPDLSGQNLSQQEQEEVINQIAKTQKPSDMIAFLKEAQSKFDFLKTQKRFKYDLKNYQIGDIFLWWEIEEITPVYIRFKDEDYSYNLRFLED
ncbi:hypothetical protein [Helicobacter ganmani]|uniref:hypothetical protein n=2 Tax=Helicobacter ganmani TaxID=60246 RepID=UPI003A8466CB